MKIFSKLLLNAYRICNWNRMCICNCCVEAFLILFIWRNVPQARVKQADLDPRVVVHYGIPSTSSILAVDRTQSLLAIGTLWVHICYGQCVLSNFSMLYMSNQYSACLSLCNVSGSNSRVHFYDAVVSSFKIPERSECYIQNVGAS